MDYLLTTALAYSLNLKPRDLFETLKHLNWIEWKDGEWQLTDLGKQNGGQIQTNAKYGDFVVWPSHLSKTWEFKITLNS